VVGRQGGQVSGVDRLRGPQVVDKGLNICGQGSTRWVLVEVVASCLPGAVCGCGMGGSLVVKWVEHAMRESCREREDVSCGFGLWVGDQAWLLGPV